MSEESIKKIDAEEFQDRTENNFFSAYLTLISIIQGAALGFLAYQESSILFANGRIMPLDPLNILYLLASLGLVVFVTHEYIWFLGVFRWKPKIRDTAIPLFIGYCEINMALSLVKPKAGSSLAWWVWVSGICFIGLLAYINSRWNCRNIFTEINSDAQKLTNRSLNKDIIVSICCLILSLSMVAVAAKNQFPYAEYTGCFFLMFLTSYTVVQGQRHMDRLPKVLISDGRTATIENMIIKEITQDIKRIEFNEIGYRKEGEDYFGYRAGKVPILITAPHGARHLRDGRWKEEDEYTAGIAIKLAELTKTYVIYVKNATREDSNHDLETKFKDKIREIVEKHGIKFVADIHGANITRTFKISVGIINDDKATCSCPTFKDTIQHSLKGFQENPFNLEGLTASKAGTITSFAKNSLNIEAAQFEINAKYRIIERKPDSTRALEYNEPDISSDKAKVFELVYALRQMITNINLIEKPA